MRTKIVEKNSGIDFERFQKLTQGMRDGLRPVPRIDCDEWADRNRRLTSESSAEPGPWRTSRVPYLRKVLKALSPTSGYTKVVVQKGVQLAFTESALNCVGTYADIDPCPIMYIMPSLEVAKSFSEDRLEPMIKNCETLKKKFDHSGKADSKNKKLAKVAPGIRIILAGANSAASLRSRPVKVLILDEADAYPSDVKGEGSPIALAEKRQVTFGDKKKTYILSTPTLDITSVVARELEKTDINKYHVPCPHCAAAQTLEFERLRWTPGEYTDVYYECKECGGHIREHHKTFMLDAGEWLPTVPENVSSSRIGFHINSLYSPSGWLSWSDIAEMYDDALKDVDLMKTFVNTILGETWKEKGEAPEWQNLFNRRESYKIGTIPSKEVSFLTAGMDVQGGKNARVEYEIVGWARGKRSYSIDYGVIEGDISEESVREKIDEVLNRTYERPDGGVLPIRMAAIDSGYNTNAVYNFCRSRNPGKIFPIKGDDGLSVPISTPRGVDVSQGGKVIGGLMLYRVGSSVLKHEFYTYLRLEKDEKGEAPKGYCFFPEYDQLYFKGIASEALQRKIVRGYAKYEWVKHYERNEPLDCRIYARAAAQRCGVDRLTDSGWDRLIAENEPKPLSQEVKKSEGFVTNNGRKKPKNSIWK